MCQKKAKQYLYHDRVRNASIENMTVARPPILCFIFFCTRIRVIFRIMYAFKYYCYYVFCCFI